MPVHRFVKEGAAGLREQPEGEPLPPLEGPSPEAPAPAEVWEKPPGEEWSAEAGKTASGDQLVLRVRPEPIDNPFAVPVKTMQGIAVSFPNLDPAPVAVSFSRLQVAEAPEPVTTEPPPIELPPLPADPSPPVAMEMLPPAIDAPPPVEEAAPAAMEILPPPVEEPALELPAPPLDAESWREAAEEWGDHKQRGPATIAALAWAPPTAVFQRAVDEMWIAWQPIADWTSRALHGYEALLHTTDTVLSRPRLLVEAAGRIGRLPELGSKARKLIAEAAGAAPEGALLFVSLHPSELLDDLLCAGEDELGPHAHRCVLEITQRVSLDDIPEARARIQQLRLVGYSIAVGSLGSGFAGLASVAELEPDIIKLDQALVRNLHNEPVRRRLIGAMLAACKDLGLAAVAEGVESAAERDALADLGCELMQGLLFGAPGRGFPGPRW
jgi:EAL domain-containing protein (putative c-di-GMP-specific phosphodiesterase class I)